MALDFHKDTASLLTFTAETIMDRLAGAADCSVHAWVRADSLTTGANDNRILYTTIATGSIGLMLNIDGSGTPTLQMSLRSSSGGNVQQPNHHTEFTTGAWHSCGGYASPRTSGASINAYFNGVVGSNVNTAAHAVDVITPAASTTADSIGSSSVAGTSATKVDGRIAEVAVWTSRLTDADFVSLARGFSPLLVKRGSLVFYAPLRGGLTRDLIGGIDGSFTSTEIVPADHPAIIYPHGPRFWFFTAAGDPPDETPPDAPTNLVANPGDGEVVLNWDDNAEGDLDHYVVYRAEDEGGGYGADEVLDDTLTESTYTDTTAENDHTYRYYVTAVDTSDNESDPSNVESDIVPEAAGGEAEEDETPEKTTLSTGQILKRLFDATDGSLRIQALGTGSGDRGTNLDAEQILQKVYDPATQSLRTVTNA